jgi:spore maturation protein CgeB
LGCGALLLTDTATDFDYLGFKDGVNYISYDVGQLKSLPKQIERILIDKEKLQSVASEGLDFVTRSHTNQHRALKLWSFIKGAL